MSFLFETFAVPLWFIVVAFGCAAPLWIKWYKMFYKRFIVTGLLQKKFQQVSDLAEDKIDVFKKANDHMNANENKKNTTKKPAKGAEMGSADQPYVKIVLKVLALNGDAGMLIQSIADDLEIKSNEMKSSLSYLEDNEFVEAVVTGSGTKYYLAARGKKYCIKRGYIAE
ncbi:MAG: hypothetical protein KAI84_17690 [Gammaproteobacteria bacterium]|nr:hypothetical protein [Gammaproteobacteria bacterium]